MRVDVVDEGKHVVRVAFVVLQRDFNADVVARGVDVNDLGVHGLFGAKQVRDELLETAARKKQLFALLALTLVLERDRNALVQIGQLAQPTRERRPVIALRFREDVGVGFEPDLGSRLLRPDGAEHLEFRVRDAATEIHVVLFAVALDPHLELDGKRVDHRHTDAVQTAGNFVRVLVEFSTGVQHRHRHLDARHPFGLVHVDRNTTTVILDGDRIVEMDRHVDLGREACQRLVDGVVDDFVDEMVQTARGRRTDVHARAHANGFEPLEGRDVVGAVFLLWLVAFGLVAAVGHGRVITGRVRRKHNP